MALQEGDTVGLLAMPDGGLVFIVNGRREFMVADARSTVLCHTSARRP